MNLEKLNDNPPSTTQIKNKTVPMILILILPTLLVGLILGYFLTTKYTIDKNDDKPTPKNEKRNAYTLSIGENFSIEIPENWYVKNVSVNYHNMTREEFEKYEMERGQVFKLPLFENSKIIITNDISNITIENKINVLTNSSEQGYPCLDPSSEIIDKPTNIPDDTNDKNTYGIARKSVNSDGKVIYYYYRIINTNLESCKAQGMAYLSLIDIDSEWIVSFEGNNEDLQTADQFYKDNF